MENTKDTILDLFVPAPNDVRAAMDNVLHAELAAAGIQSADPEYVSMIAIALADFIKTGSDFQNITKAVLKRQSERIVFAKFLSDTIGLPTSVLDKIAGAELMSELNEILADAKVGQTVN